jgi:PadR family transcriptional regulator AphA
MRLISRSLLDEMVLCLLDESPRHGFAVARELAADAGLASVVRVRRPLVYRAIADLGRAGLVRAVREEPGAQGGPRTVWATTATGSREVRVWLDATVAHPRDARLELLAKFVLRERRGMSTAALARRQRARFERAAVAMRARRPASAGGAGVVALWREETLRAMLRTLRRLERQAAAPRRRGGRGTKRGVRAT